PISRPPRRRREAPRRTRGSRRVWAGSGRGISFEPHAAASILPVFSAATGCRVSSVNTKTHRPRLAAAALTATTMGNGAPDDDSTWLRLMEHVLARELSRQRPENTTGFLEGLIRSLRASGAPIPTLTSTPY